VIVLINGGPALDRFGPARHVGRLVSPRCGNRIDPGQLWAADNDAYLAWDDGRFVKMLNRLDGTPNCLFVSAPDVVGDARGTLARFWEWRLEIAGRGFPVAMVAQDGAEDLDLPWDAFDCLFVGGKGEGRRQWKLSAAAADLVHEANRRGKWSHMGRVNSRRRLRIARDAGCKSVDGSGWSKFPDKYLKRDLPLIAELTEQRTIFDGIIL
jgi:hypothetical protein